MESLSSNCIIGYLSNFPAKTCYKTVTRTSETQMFSAKSRLREIAEFSVSTQPFRDSKSCAVYDCREDNMALFWDSIDNHATRNRL